MRIETDKIYCGDSLQVLQTLPDNCMDCCVTSPPYYALRDYGTDGQIGREATPEKYVSRITAVFHEVKRVLTPEGTCWLNIADTYCGTGSKADHQDPKSVSYTHLKVGYVWLTIGVNPVYVDTGIRIESAADLCGRCLDDVASDVLYLSLIHISVFWLPSERDYFPYLSEGRTADELSASPIFRR